MALSSTVLPTLSDLNPSRLLIHPKFEHATCGMSKETVSFLRTATTQDKLNSTNSGCEELARILAQKVSGLSVAVMVAPPVGGVICFCTNQNNDTRHESQSTTVSAMSFDIIIWLLLDITDIDSKQTTFIQRKVGNRDFFMKALYRLAPSSHRINNPNSSKKTGSLKDVAENIALLEDDIENLVGIDPMGRVVEKAELDMLRSANMLGSIRIVPRSISATSGGTQTSAQEDDDTCMWLSRVQELINRAEYKTERPLPCEVIPGLYLSSVKEARSGEALNQSKITHVFSCIDDPEDPVDGERARARCEEAGAVFRGIWSEDEIQYEMLAQHFDQFYQFVNPIISCKAQLRSQQLNLDDPSKTAQEVSSPTNPNQARVLVHCTAGVNRSGVLVVAYVMKAKQLPILKALQWCLEARGPLLWNVGFQKQLINFARAENLLVLEST